MSCLNDLLQLFKLQGLYEIKAHPATMNNKSSLYIPSFISFNEVLVYNFKCHSKIDGLFVPLFTVTESWQFKEVEDK